MFNQIKSMFSSASKAVASVSTPKTTKTGIQFVDDVLSSAGGFVQGQVILMTGEPGCGKTTLAAQWGMFLPQKAVMISYEMPSYQMGGLIKRITSQYAPHTEENLLITEEQNLDEVLQGCKDNGITMIVLDSIQYAAKTKWAAEKFNKKNTDDSLQTDIMMLINKFAKSSFISVVVIGHVNKDGSYKGPSGIVHDCDTHIHLETIDADVKWRRLCVTKNRMGGNTHLLYWLLADDVAYTPTKYTKGREIASIMPARAKYVVKSVDWYKDVNEWQRREDNVAAGRNWYDDVEPTGVTDEMLDKIMGSPELLRMQNKLFFGGD